MNRKELYAQVTKFNLQDKIKEVFKKNYTNLSNIDLEKAVSNFTPVCKDPNRNIIEKLCYTLYNKKVITKNELEGILK